MKKYLKIIFFTMFFLIFSFLILELFLKLNYGKRLIWEFDNITYWHFKESQEGYAVYGGPISKINAHGFRGSEYDSSKKSIALLGDSYTFGYGLKDNETFSHLLNIKLEDKNVQTINMGVPGLGPYQILKKYENDFKKFSPEITILTLVKEDIVRQSLDASQISDLIKIGNIRQFLQWTLFDFFNKLSNNYFSHRFSVVKVYYDDKYKNLYNWNEMGAYWNLTKLHILELNNLIVSNDSTFIVIVYPDIFYNDDYETDVTAFLIENNISYIKINFLGYNSTELINSYNHPSYMANKILSNFIYNHLKSI